MLSRIFLVPVVALGVFAAATPARATVLAPGTSVIPDAVANPLTDPTFTVVGSISGNFNASNIDIGTFTQTVVRESSGKLDFVFQFANSADSQTAVERMSTYNYQGFATAVSFVDGSGDRAPISADRTGGGTVVAFNFSASNAVPTGATSDLLIIRTDATAFDTSGTFSIQDGAATTVLGIFAPTSAPAVPEPSALALTGLGGLCLLGYSRRRSRPAIA